MATLDFQRFTRVEILRAIQPRLLSRLLAPHRDFLEARGVILPPHSSDEHDYPGLVKTFMSPDENTPHQLTEALYLINEMASTPGCIDALQEEAASREVAISFPADASPEDIAIQVWLEAPTIVERKHAEHALVKQREFKYFQSATSPRPIHTTTDMTIKALERDLDDWFESYGRGRTSKIFTFAEGEETWVLIRHGKRCQSEGSIKDGASTTIVYRPEIFNLVIYNNVIGELRINAETKGMTHLFRQQFGKHFFGSEDFFPACGPSKYTLEPLRRDGLASLFCGDVEGIQSVRLHELRIYWGGKYGELEIRRANDLLAAMTERNRFIHENAHMVSAKFQVQFTHTKKPRLFTIRPANIISVLRDEDTALVEQWLTLRHFASVNTPAADEDSPPPTEETTHADANVSLV